MTQKETALARLSGNRLLYIDMLEVLRRGTAQIRRAGPDGVLLYDPPSEVWFLDAETPAALDEMLPMLDGCVILTGHQMWYKDKLAAHFGFQTEQICRQSAWLAPQPPVVPSFDGELRWLDRSWAVWTEEHYSHSFGGVSYMEDAIDRGMLGAFVDGQPAGFIATHIEGSMGMLEVLPQYRRRGIGEALLLAMTASCLERGIYPYGQVWADNDPSLALQRKVGMTLSEELLFWLF
ncbi:GNAT family N-acetyltransferase [Flavonifractor sp. An52]|uniref:GNAT family N-acetyltransferase n=1 Tax=Flavonifractor sp. An52 TaxID=1965642 RepID=UPI000B388A4C|nr:N-acetyltransferase [Flavonifractor sp. An52]OUN83380.1 GNAT family N-acetyltransferase [Flavonifractor sp. An52]